MVARLLRRGSTTRDQKSKSVHPPRLQRLYALLHICIIRFQRDDISTATLLQTQFSVPQLALWPPLVDKLGERRVAVLQFGVVCKVPSACSACLPACLCSVVFGLDGEWFIENRGAIPDIVVDNLPHATFLGEDAQLRRGVAELLTQLQSDPIETPVHPPYPDRSYQGKIHRFAQHKQLTTAPLTWNASIVSGPVNEQCP